MKKVYLKVAMVAVVATVASMGIYSSQTTDVASDIALANVEALARGELPGGTCWGTAAGGGNQSCPGGDKICCWAHLDVFGEN